MGRKSKRKHNQDPEDVAKADKKDITLLCKQLLEITSRPTPLAPAKQWEEFLQINGLVEKICKKQHDTSFEGNNRRNHIDDFMAWANTEGISCDSVAIQEFNEGLGLGAIKEIKEQDPFLMVPRKAMLTEDCVLESPLGVLIKKDSILQGMAHVALALFLLMERQTEQSVWKPYINILPSSYHVPLYFSPDELQQLQGSPAYTDALKQHKNIGRQFAYFYKLFQMSAESSKLSLKDSFTYEGYRWAVSTVMSRQNQIPSEDGSRHVTALIPLWDMCNHTNGVITTTFNLHHDSCEGLALHDISVGEQVCIFYGLRSNAHLLLYSGFVFPDSECDSVNIQLGVSKNDRLYAMRSQLLAMMGFSESSINLPVEGGDNPISPELIAFLRVFSMDEEELKHRMFDKNKAESLGRLIRPNCLISKANELRVWSFLETRLSLLLRQYKTAIEEDIDLLGSSELSANTKLCVQLRLTEKLILNNAIAHIQTRRRAAEELPADALCYQNETEDGGTETEEVPKVEEDGERIAEIARRDTEDAGKPKTVARRDTAKENGKEKDVGKAGKIKEMGGKDEISADNILENDGNVTEDSGRNTKDEGKAMEVDEDKSKEPEETKISNLTGNQSDDSGSFHRHSSSSLLGDTNNDSFVLKGELTESVDDLNNALTGINMNGDGGEVASGKGNKCVAVSNGHDTLNGE